MIGLPVVNVKMCGGNGMVLGHSVSHLKKKEVIHVET